MSESSIFTRIINKEIPAKIVYEDDTFLAFHDIHPMAPVHVLLVPKKEHKTLEHVELSDEEFHKNLLLIARQIARELGIQDNYKLIMNVGEQVQQVLHVHLHILGGWEQTKQTEEIDAETND